MTTIRSSSEFGGNGAEFIGPRLTLRTDAFTPICHGFNRTSASPIYNKGVDRNGARSQHAGRLLRDASERRTTAPERHTHSSPLSVTTGRTSCDAANGLDRTTRAEPGQRRPHGSPDESQGRDPTGRSFRIAPCRRAPSCDHSLSAEGRGRNGPLRRRRAAARPPGFSTPTSDAKLGSIASRELSFTRSTDSPCLAARPASGSSWPSSLL